MKITAVDIALCPLSLKTPIHIGTVQLTTRDYVAVRLSTDRGIQGFALGFRSGTALPDIAAALAPGVLGRDPFMSRAFLGDIETAMVPARASIGRALSLFEIALWDVVCKACEQPLYRLLGGLRRSVPALAVTGFSYEARDPADVEDELERHIQEGLRHIKLLIRGNNSRFNAAYVARMVRRVNGRARIVVDAHWSWRTLTEAWQTCAAIDDFGLGFIEDPFLPEQWRLAAELRSKLKTPLAMGEDIVDPLMLFEILHHVDVVRVDATVSGGVSGAMSALGLAAAFGREAIPHVFTGLHLHLACAHPTVGAVEYIPAQTDADPVNALLASSPELQQGEFLASDEPGNGICLDWEAVSRHAVTCRSVNLRS